jgi:hypothetical protein
LKGVVTVYFGVPSSHILSVYGLSIKIPYYFLI